MDRLNQLRRLAIKGAGLSAVAVLCVLGAGDVSERAVYWAKIKYAEAEGYISGVFRTVERVEVPIDPEDTPTELIISEVSHDYGIDPIITTAIIVTESGWDMRHDRMRYEPHLLGRFKREGWQSDEEHRMFASSFGLMQVVYGIHRKDCRLESWADLLNRRKNIECGLLVLQKCLDMHRDVERPAERLRRALGCYNGDRDNYPARVFSNLAQLAIDGRAQGLAGVRLSAVMGVRE